MNSNNYNNPTWGQTPYRKPFANSLTPFNSGQYQTPLKPDYSNMTTREELEARFSEQENRKKAEEVQQAEQTMANFAPQMQTTNNSFGQTPYRKPIENNFTPFNSGQYQTPLKPDYSNMTTREELEARFNEQENRKKAEEKQKNESQNFSDNGIVDTLIGWLPEYQALNNAKAEMEKMNTKGADNYAHRLGMCKVGQMSYPKRLFAPTTGVVLGIAKEAQDLYHKSMKGNMPWQESLADSLKDMQNNWEGLNYGVNYPNSDCNEWLKKLDYRRNQWRSK